MGNRLSPGCCCGACISSYLGYSPSSFPLDVNIGFILGNDELRQESLDSASLAGHDVVVATGNAKNYNLPSGGRWASSLLTPITGALFNLSGMAPPLETGVAIDIRYIWAPAESSGEDIFGGDSIILHITGTVASAQLNVSLVSDWDDINYSFGIGEMTFADCSIQFARYVGLLVDSVYGLDHADFPYNGIPGPVNGANLRIATYHRPIKASIPRRLHIVNDMTVDWFFNGLSIWGVTDDRTPDKDASESCPSVFVENRGTIGNEPFIVDTAISGRDGVATHFSIRRLNDHNLHQNILDDGTRWTGRACAMRKPVFYDPEELEPVLPESGEPDEEIWVDLIDPNIVYTAQFGPTEIVSAANNQAVTVLCELHVKVYRDRLTPAGFEGQGNDQNFKLLNTVDFSFAFPAWARGEMPEITIVPGASPNTIVVNGTIEGTSTEWIAPKLITRQKYKFEGHFDSGVFYGSWIAKNEWETETLDRVIVIRPAVL